MKYLCFMLLFCSNTTFLYAQCTGCTTTISTNSSTSQTINGNNQKICITGGTYTGNITLNGAGNRICIGSSATIGTGASLTLNGTNIIVDNYGSITLTNLQIQNNTTFRNYGTIIITNQLTISGNSSYNQIEGSTTVGSFNVNSDSLNVSGGAFQQNNVSQASNNNSGGIITITNNAPFDIAGSFTNNDRLNILESTLKIGGNFTNNGSGVVNLNGLLQTTGNVINNGSIQISGDSCSLIEATNFTNNGSGNINGTANANIDVCNSGTFTNFGTINNRQSVACSCNIQLAVTLQYFSTAYHQTKNQVVLTWRAISDETNDAFVVQKSSDGINFQNIAEIESIYSTQVQDYIFIDEASLSGNIYYRLQIIESNGKIFYSPLRVVHITNTDTDFSVFPNPTSKSVFVQLLNANNATCIAKIYDMKGQIVKNISLSSEKTNEINISDLNEGVYFMECTDFSGKNTFMQRTKKIVVLK